MRTLIVLCAGNRKIDGKPLFLQRHPQGKLIAEKAIEGVFPEKYDRIIYSLLEEVDSDFRATDIIKKEMGSRYPVETCILKDRTKGPAETVYKTLIQCNIQGEVVVRDSHNFIKLAKDYSGNFIAGLDLTKYSKTIENLRTKSFIVTNEQKQVLDVIEKHFCSDVISTGLYGFKKSDDFKYAYEKLNDKNYPIEKLYISHVISYLIGCRSRVYTCSYVEVFEDWTTQLAWEKLQLAYSTCFINIDTIFEEKNIMENSLIYKLKRASANGCRFVLFSSQSDEYAMRIKKHLEENEVCITGVILGCTMSKSILMVNNIYDIEKIPTEV